ncbi:MAG: AraC family transcriptional regulator [Pseudomonadota bacterium]
MALTEALSRLQKQLGQINLTDLPKRHVGVNRCQRAQCLTRMTVLEPTVMLPVHGKKKIRVGEESYAAEPGEMLLLPPGIEIDIDNQPDIRVGCFESALLVFDTQTLDLFGKLHGPHFDTWHLVPQWKAVGSDAFLAAVSDWVAFSYAFDPDQMQTRHRMAELLLILARQGVVGNLMQPVQARTSSRVKHILRLDPAHDWRAADLTVKLGMSESTLRRRLRAEGCSFRDLLEDVRLEHGVEIVMATDMPISQIAFQCGYVSQSRFAERFRKRFSLSPTDLRATRRSSDADVIPLIRQQAS